MGAITWNTEQLWEVLPNAWEEYPDEKIARMFAHHSQVAAAMHNCKGGDEFVQERKGLGFGVQKVYKPYYGEEGTAENTRAWIWLLLMTYLLELQKESW